MVDFLIILLIAAILGGAGFYIYKSKKAGAKCIGCPHAKNCGSQHCSCGEQ